MRKLVFLLVSAVAAMCALSTAQAATPVHLLEIELQGATIKGESTIKDREGWIVAKSAAQEVTNLTGANPVVGYFLVVKSIDRASVLLTYHAAMGTVLDKVTFEYAMVDAIGLRVQYRVDLKGGRIILVNPEVSGGSESESVAFGGFTEITWTYYRYSGNRLLPPVARTFTMP